MKERIESMFARNSAVRVAEYVRSLLRDFFQVNNFLTRDKYFALLLYSRFCKFNYTQLRGILIVLNCKYTNQY